MAAIPIQNHGHQKANLVAVIFWFERTCYIYT